MTRHIDADICVIGAGSAGLSVAAGAAQLGARTVLFERGQMGGECLNVGCVPSKTLIASARSSKAVSEAHSYGVKARLDGIDYARAMDRVQKVIDEIAPHDSQERFEGLGVQVFRSSARFVGPGEVAGDGVSVRARRFVIATGSTAAIPPIEGLDSVPYFTNDSIFTNNERPDRLLVIGGGPIGVEMAQAHHRLGSRVTVVEAERFMSREDPEITALLRDRLVDEGIEIIEGAEVKSVRQSGAAIDATVEIDGERTISVSHILVAAGRRPQIDGLDLGEASVEHGPRGILVDGRLRTTNRKIFAIGDVAGGPQFTHVAGYHAGIVIRNALFRLPAKVDYRALPWVTFTDPELARIGLTESEARQKHGDRVRVVRSPFGELDRARTDGRTDGTIKVVVGKRGEIYGVTILGDHAGELIHVWSLAMSQKLDLKAIASAIAPYPTLGEISKKAASAFYAEKLFSAWPRRVVRFLSAFG
jgi:pyruvate/2-oxoglutarate dehydrogenase complex dihydrolipoamide dehydrogenase (E3) component